MTAADLSRPMCSSMADSSPQRKQQVEDVAELVDGEEVLQQCDSRQILEAVSGVGLAVDVAVVVVLQCGVSMCTRSRRTAQRHVPCR